MSLIRPALVLFIMLTLLTGGVYPLLTTSLGQWWFKMCIRDSRQSFPQPANKRVLKRGEDFIHFAAAGQYAAGRQQDAVVKSLARCV